MTRAAHRVLLTRAYVLHQRPFRDTSLILEAFTREHGRLTLFARAARGPRSRFTALQPFRALLVSWSGRGEAPSLTGAEAAPGVQRLPSEQLLSAFYLNELLLKLLTRHDPHPQLFDCYEATLAALAAGETADATLRQFELRLLDYIGFGLNLGAEADTGEPVRGEGFYRFAPGVNGFVVAEPSDANGIAGRVLKGLASAERLESEADLRQARALMRAALDQCLEGRSLSTRSVARALAKYPRRERRV